MGTTTSHGGSHASPLDQLCKLIEKEANQAARRRKKPGSTVTQKDEADALGLSASTYYRITQRMGIPWESKLRDLPLADAVTRELLRLRKEAVAQRREPSRDGTRGTNASATGTLTMPAQAVPAHATPDTPAVNAVIDGTRADADEGGENDAKLLEGGPDVTIGTTAHVEDDDQHGRQETPGSSAPRDDFPARLAAALQRLADAVFDECDEIASDPRYDLQLPLPLPLRWRLADDQLDQAIDNAVTGHRGHRFDPLPGIDPASTDTVRAGGPEELFALHTGLPSGRIVVTGRYGSGKSTTAILTILDVLDHRRRLPGEQRADVPVPVRLAATTWNPVRQSLRTWFAGQLTTMYEFLTSSDYGVDAAGTLIRRGKVSLFLEGLDQMAPGLRKQALMHLAAEHSFRVVVMSRPEEYAEAAAAVPLPGALVVQLEPVPTEDAVDYLRRRQDGPGSEDTGALIEHLKQQSRSSGQPGSPLSQALDSPLFLTLLRADPTANASLLTADRFQTRRQVEDFLLARVVPRAFSVGRPPGLTEQDSRQWDDHIATQQNRLELVASQMDGTDLAWWQIHHWTPARWRCLANALAGVLVMGGLGMLVFGPVGQYTVNSHTGIEFGLPYGMFMGGCFGLLAGMISEARDLRPASRDKIEKILERAGLVALKDRWRRHRSGAPAPFNPAIAVLILAIVTMAVGNQSGHLLGYLLFGLPTGLVAAAAAGCTASRPRLIPIGRSWWATWRPSRADLLAALTIGAPIGFTYELTKTVRYGVLAGLFTAFTLGLMISVARPVSNPDISTTPFTRWRQDRHRALRIGLAAGTPIGTALGFQNGLAHGPLAGITVALGLGTIIALGCMAGVSDSWRTTLAFAQLHLHTRWRRHRSQDCPGCQQRHGRGVFPLRGMRFFQEACDRDVMRISGPYLQFWHARLQELLASTPCTATGPTQPQATQTTAQTP